MSDRFTYEQGDLVITHEPTDNAKPKRKGYNLLKHDPTRTATIRRAWITKLRKRFKGIKGRMRRLVLTLAPVVVNCAADQMRGADGRCGPGIGVGINREEMPQIKTDEMEGFIAFAKHRGVEVNERNIKASDLSPTQKEFRQERVDEISEDTLQSTRILISQDDYILDGTHRWIKHWQKDKDTLVPVRQIMLPLHEALRLMRAFPKVVFATNASWSSLPDPNKVKSFKDWIEGMMEEDIVGTDEDALWRLYVEQAYKKGAGRAFDDTRTKRSSESLDFYKGSRDQFLRDTFAQPVSIDRVKSLAGRAYNELDGVSDQMGTRMARTLADGLAEGKSPYDIADDLDEELDIGARRSEVIARTEISRAHAEGQLTALEKMGVKQLGVEVEWLATPDEKTCPECADMEGKVFDIEEAKGMLPLHPSCRCAWIPANVGEDDDDQEEVKVDDEGEKVENVLGNFNPNHDEQGRFASADSAGPQPSMESDLARYLDPKDRKEFNKALKDRNALNKKVKEGTATDADKQALKDALSLREKHITEARKLRDEKGVAPPPPKETPKKEEAKKEPKKQETVEKGSQILTRQYLRDKLSKVPEWNKASALTAILDEHAKPDGERRNHHMPEAEKVKSIMLDGLKVSYSEKANLGNKVTKSLVNILSANMPKKLWEANTEIIYSSQRCANDSHWEKAFSMPGFRALATGGSHQREIVVYDHPGLLDSVSFAHESGHNLGQKIWGTSFPPEHTDYAKAQKADKKGAVSEYGSNTSAEDFAEACAQYATPPGYGMGHNRNSLASKHPEKYKVIKQMLGDE